MRLANLITIKLVVAWARGEGVARVGIRNALHVVGADKNVRKSRNEKM